MADTLTANLPHAADAERSVLGAVLLDNAQFDRAREMLTDQAFYSGEPIVTKLSKHNEEDQYYLKRSDSPYIFKVTKFHFETVQKITVIQIQDRDIE